MSRNFGFNNLRHSEQPEAKEIFAWIPTRVTSGKLVWFNYYWHVKVYTNVEPKHKWVMETTYTQWEYFIKKLRY